MKHTEWVGLPFRPLLLAGCQHQPEEIGLTAVSAVYQKQQAENQKIRNSQNKTRKSSPLSSMKW